MIYFTEKVTTIHNNATSVMVMALTAAVGPAVLQRLTVLFSGLIIIKCQQRLTAIVT